MSKGRWKGPLARDRDARPRVNVVNKLRRGRLLVRQGMRLLASENGNRGPATRRIWKSLNFVLFHVGFTRVVPDREWRWVNNACEREGRCQVDIVDGDNAAEIAGEQRGLTMTWRASDWLAPKLPGAALLCPSLSRPILSSSHSNLYCPRYMIELSTRTPDRMQVGTPLRR